MNVDLRSALRLAIFVASFTSSAAFAQCAPWETQCTPPEFPGGDLGGEAPNRSGNTWFVPNAPGNPYPATCASSREQRALHAAFDIAAVLSGRADADVGHNYWVAYDDGGTQTYYDGDILNGVPASPLILQGGVVQVAPGNNNFFPDVCDQFNPYY